MSKGPENTFIAGVHKHLPPDLYRMKNHNEYAGGIADCWYSGKARDLWIEYKFVTIPKRDTTLIRPFAEMTPLQRDWCLERTREGRHVWLVVGCPEGGVIFDVLWGNVPAWEGYETITPPKWRGLLEARQQIANQIMNFCQGQ